jgi:hypothetical protein
MSHESRTMKISQWFKKKGISGPKTLEPLIRLRRHDVVEVCQDFDLQDESRKYLVDTPQANSFLACLIHDEGYFDAIRFLAYALPEREAVWWACQCIRCMPVCFQGEIATQALESAEAWVHDSRPESCRNALDAAKKHAFDMPTSPAAWTAMAAACTSHELGEAEGHPEPKLSTAYSAAGAITLAASSNVDHMAERCAEFIDMGVKIAQGKQRIPAQMNS